MLPGSTATSKTDEQNDNPFSPAQYGREGVFFCADFTGLAFSAAFFNAVFCLIEWLVHPALFILKTYAISAKPLKMPKAHYQA